MTEREIHIQQAAHNEDAQSFLEKADRAEYWDWEIITLFYSALHYIEGYFAKDEIHCENHDQRGEMLQADMSTRDLFDEYRVLENAASHARYHPEYALRSDIRERIKKHKEYIKKIKDRIGC